PGAWPGLRGRLRRLVPERSLGPVPQLEADWRQLSAGARLHATRRDPDDKRPIRVSAPATAMGHPTILFRARAGIHHEPREPSRELAVLHSALQRAHRVG